MRYYDISITEPSQGTGSKPIFHATSHPNGPSAPPDPGAPQVEFDLYQLTAGTDVANSWMRIWGIPLSVISRSRNLSNKNIAIKGGMGKGLPLANPKQAGMLAGGMIYQAFGNWIGVDMTLDLLLLPGYVQQAQNPEPRNLGMNLQPGQKMADAIDQTLQTGYPGLKRNISISDNLVVQNQEAGYYGTLPQFAPYVQNLSRQIIGGANYAGVNMTVNGDTVTVTDGTAKQNVKQISFLDLIGQPTWIGPQLVQVTCVMRSDIKIFDVIKLPPGLLTTQAGALPSLSALKQETAFQGQYVVNKIHHIGNFRQKDGRSWCTILDCLFQPMGPFPTDNLGPGYTVDTGPQ